ncbi:MAG: MFS transporter [Actinomycetales bacterium]|nr:MAG: MFS transporter [Actinomycetales bacterium]
MSDTARSRSSYRVTYAVVAVAVASFALVQSMTIPVLGEIQDHFGASQSTATWVLTAYLLSASVATPIVGRVGDAVGKEKMLVFSISALALGSLIAALAPSIGVMIGARVIQGIGGGVLPLAFGIVRDEFPEDKMAPAISLTSSLMAVGMGIGIVVAGPIITSLGYAGLFWLPFGVTAVAAVAAAVLVPESPVRKPGRISILPAVMLAAWLVALLLPVSQGRIVPLVDMRMMKLPAVWTTNLVALLVGVGMYAAFGFTPQFNQTPEIAGYGFGASVTVSGLMMLPSAVMTFVTGLVASRIAVRIGPKAVVVAGCVVASAAMFLQAGWHDERWHMLLANGLMGLGVGLAFACLASLIVAAVPPEQTGVASGMNANIRTIGGGVGSAVMGSIVTASIVTSTGLPSEAGYTIGFAALAGAFLVAALAALTIPTRSEVEVEDALLAEPESGTQQGLVAQPVSA